MWVTVCSERSSCPCLRSGVDGKSVSRPVGLWNFQGTFLIKKNTAQAAQRWILSGWIGGKMNRVCCGAVNLSGMIRGEAVFKMNTTTSCGWLQANPQKQRDLWQRISRIERCVKIIWKKLLRQSGDSRTYRRLLELFFLFTATMIAIGGLWLVRAEKGFHDLLQRIMSSTLPASSKDDLMGV